MTSTPFHSIIREFISVVTTDPRLEVAWLNCMAKMEAKAADQIRGSISKSTPENEIQTIREHAADEDRHCAEILKMIPAVLAKKSCLDQDYLSLESDFMRISETFVMGFFGNPFLSSLKGKHPAYVHGAMTIEMFPFQTYGAYIKKTKIEEVKEKMPAIIAEEKGHIQLGERLFKKLPKEKQLNLSKLHIIEKEFGYLAIKRLKKRANKFLKQDEDHQFEEQIMSHPMASLAWIWSLASELLSKEEANILKRSILLTRRQYTQDPVYKMMESSFSASIQASQKNFPLRDKILQDHLRTVFEESMDISLSHALLGYFKKKRLRETKILTEEKETFNTLQRNILSTLYQLDESLS
ncbi:MAG: hypothetical protein HN509_10200 [Halobacteriovoraceae bacterium]|jgi:hypothetical protein|nr:hypothetical protein [Halobacteriovoraceae bacterium]